MQSLTRGVFLLLLFAQVSVGAPLSKKRFEALLMHHVSQMNELAPLWSASPSQAVYLSGSVLRGLIHRLKTSIDAVGYQKTWDMRTPAIRSLITPHLSDKDIVAPRHLKGWAEDLLNHGRRVDPNQVSQNLRIDSFWDVVGDDFMKYGDRVGGATLDKVLVNPWGVKDPENALGDYLNGKLVFRLGDDPADHRVDRENKLVNYNTRLTLGLRFLRLAAELPEAKISPESLKQLRQIDKLERDGLERSPGTDAFVEKALIKLFDATQKDPAQFLKLLKTANLLGILSHHNYFLKNHWPGSGGFEAFLRRNHKSWTLEEKMNAATILSDSSYQTHRNLKTLLALHSTPSDKRKIRRKIETFDKISSRANCATDANTLGQTLRRD